MESEMMELIDELPDTYFYRVTYDQGARMGRWRIIAVEKGTYRDVIGTSAPSIPDARRQLIELLETQAKWDNVQSTAS
jgi:hypothetical protein